jgi:hypothetical protein
VVSGCQHRGFDQQPALVVKFCERLIGWANSLAHPNLRLFGLSSLCRFPRHPGRLDLGRGTVSEIVLHHPAIASPAAAVEVLVVLSLLPCHDNL